MVLLDGLVLYYFYHQVKEENKVYIVTSSNKNNSTKSPMLFSEWDVLIVCSIFSFLTVQMLLLALFPYILLSEKMISGPHCFKVQLLRS